LETCGKPVVAAINGTALGGGFELCLACHHRIMADTPRLVVGLPEVSVGLIPGGGGTQRLPRLLGVARALPLLLQGKLLTPAEALEFGLVGRVVPASELVETACAWIATQGDAQQPWDRKGYTVPGGSSMSDPKLAALYSQTTASLARETQRNYPAPMAILRAVAHGVALPIAAGLRTEAREFTLLFASPVPRNIVRTLFINKSAAEKLARRPAKVARAEHRKIGVLGAGMMGTGIARVSAAAGLEVVLLDSTLELATASVQRLQTSLARQVAQKRMTVERVEETLRRIHPTADYSDLEDCSLIIEAVFEDRDVKTQAYAKADAVVPGAIVASNTSTIPITSMAHAIRHPDRFIGLHFFSPVDRMALVEVIRGESTSDQTLAHALDFVRRIRKVPIIVKDARGFFTSRVFGQYLIEGMTMLAEGVAPALIENAARQAGMPVGPLTLMDEVTLVPGLQAAEQEARDLGDQWRPNGAYAVQRKFVYELDRKGRRFGKGFYEYSADGTKRLWRGLSEVYPPLTQQPDVDEVRRRLLYVQSLEAVKCLEEGIVSDVGEADVGAVLGFGFPSYTGGVFSLVDSVGLSRFATECVALAERYGERFRPSDSLLARARAGRAFYPAAN
jgi:3-hydroxyacyl-CoA dehydrogenase/enoyl-CoA hydratase/3-hydroxybutyryl-CoA epimerase